MKEWLINLLLTDDEKRIRTAINNSGLKTMRVVGRGTLKIDGREIAQQEWFKQYVRRAKVLMENQRRENT